MIEIIATVFIVLCAFLLGVMMAMVGQHVRSTRHQARTSTPPAQPQTLPENAQGLHVPGSAPGVPSRNAALRIVPVGLPGGLPKPAHMSLLQFPSEASGSPGEDRSVRQAVNQPVQRRNEESLSELPAAQEYLKTLRQQSLTAPTPADDVT